MTAYTYVNLEVEEIGGGEVEADSKENLTLTLLAVGIVITYDEARRETRKENCEEALSAAPLCSCSKAWEWEFGVWQNA